MTPLVDKVSFDCTLHRVEDDTAFVTLVNSAGVELVRRLSATFLAHYGIDVDDEFILEVEFIASEPVVRVLPKPRREFTDDEVDTIWHDLRQSAIDLMQGD